VEATCAAAQHDEVFNEFAGHPEDFPLDSEISLDVFREDRMPYRHGGTSELEPRIATQERQNRAGWSGDVGAAWGYVRSTSSRPISEQRPVC
jgi:hypothetical protein